VLFFFLLFFGICYGGSLESAILAEILYITPFILGNFATYFILHGWTIIILKVVHSSSLFGTFKRLKLIMIVDAILLILFGYGTTICSAINDSEYYYTGKKNFFF